MRRIATELKGPLHPYTNQTVQCAQCGKTWLDYLDCDRKDCLPEYTPQPEAKPKPRRGTAGYWVTLF